MGFKLNRSDLIFLGLLGLLIFTPAGTFLKVQVNRLLAFAPSSIEVDKRETLNDYNWSLEDAQGNRLNFNNFKDKPTLINFWATWCPPCIAEMPDLNRLYNLYKDKVNFVFVSTEDAETVESFLNKNQYNFKSLKPLGPPPGLLQSSALPTTYLLGANGVIIIKKTGAANWDHERVKDLLNELIEGH